MTRITADTVRALAVAADEAGGKGSDKHHYGNVQIQSDLDRGGRYYVASHAHEAWRGRGATVRAAAYYLGVVDAFKANAYLDLPHRDNVNVRRAGPTEWPTVRDALFQQFTGEVVKEYGRGLDEGNARHSILRGRPATEPAEPDAFNYEAYELNKVLSDGPDEESGGVFRVKVTGKSAETRWLSATTEQVQAIRAILSNS